MFQFSFWGTTQNIPIFALLYLASITICHRVYINIQEIKVIITITIYYNIRDVYTRGDIRRELHNNITLHIRL